MDTLSRKRYAITTKLVAKVLGFGSSLRNIPAVNYGIDNEDNACAFFKNFEEGRHTGFRVDRCGLYIKAERPYIACSPDRLVRCSCHGTAVLEMKCPYVLRLMGGRTLSSQAEWGYCFKRNS
jgi:hypothetical protein